MGFNSGFKGLKRPGLEVYHSLPFNHEVMDEWLYSCTPLRAVMTSAGTLIVTETDSS